MQTIKIATLIAVLAATALNSWAGDLPWNGKKAAVVLTYDDALEIDIDTVLPALRKEGFKATFYVTPSFPGFQKRVADWKALAAEGHELGNHTLFHPCEGNRKGREWVAADRDLSKWSKKRIVDDIQVTNTLLEGLDGKTERTFAYPCGDTKAGGESYVDDIRPMFVAARGVTAGLQTLDEVNLFNVNSYMAMGDTADKLTKMVDDAIAQRSLMVFLFHGVGGGHSINVDAKVHAELLAYIKAHSADIWVAPMVDVANYIKQQQATK